MLNKYDSFLIKEKSRSEKIMRSWPVHMNILLLFTVKTMMGPALNKYFYYKYIYRRHIPKQNSLHWFRRCFILHDRFPFSLLYSILWRMGACIFFSCNISLFVSNKLCVYLSSLVSLEAIKEYTNARMNRILHFHMDGIKRQRQIV